MDPITAFGLAANVVSFISFASDLINTTIELYRSDSGSTADLLSLEKVYGDLRGLGNRLEHACQQPLAQNIARPSDSSVDSSVERTMLAIKSLAEMCKQDCDELLRITDCVRPQNDGDTKSKWKAFRRAMDGTLREGDFEKIEDRLHQRQTTLALHICSISGFYYNGQSRLQNHSFGLQIDRNKGIKDVKTSLTRCEQMLADVQNGKGHKLTQLGDHEFLGQLFRTLHTIQDLQSKMQRFIQSLQYEARSRRQEAISEAHEQTFRWLLDDNESEDQDRSAFSQWLESKDGIFWVSGKPGSGKSTFMKFVAGAVRTRELVNRWASPTILVAHYFWNSGSPIQKSIEGLLRSLLYDIFQKCPDLIPLTCEGRWRQLDDPNAQGGIWSSTSLIETLRKVTLETSHKRINFCLFIDGLDEFEGTQEDQYELCKMLRELAQFQHIKLCVSSRPWEIFEDAFGAGPKMYIHDLTRNDMRNYVSSRLREHPRWIDSTYSNQTDGQRLVDQIVERSDGAFLWVILVTKLLREGLTNRDRFTDLCRRLESLPQELGPLLRHILDSLEPIYHAKASTMLQVALAAEKPLPMLMYDFHDLEHDDEYYYLKRRVEPLTKDKLSDVKSRIPFYLDSRTRGLLEVSSSQEVTFLHRTVKDYLTEHAPSIFPETQLPKGSSRAFNPQLSILRAYAAWVKCAAPDTLWRHDFAEYSSSGPTDGNTPSILELTTDLIPYAVHLDPLSRWDPRIGEALDDIENSVTTLISRTRSSAGSSRGEARNEKHLQHEHRIGVDRITFQGDYAWKRAMLFRESLLQAGVTNYVAAKELKEPMIWVPQTNERFMGDNQHRHTDLSRPYHLEILLNLLGWLWKVYLIILRRLLFLLCPFLYNLSSFLVERLPLFVTRSFMIPLMSALVKFVYENDC